jgi:small-conductance mechanosensitive channel/CRP-like cAMP-binding protein
MFGLSDWMMWGIALLVLFPVLIIGLGEVAEDMGGSARFKAYETPVMIVRNGVLPLAFGAILLRYVAGVGSQELVVKIVDTLLWIIVLNAALAFSNLLLFNNANNRVRIPKLLLDILRFFFVVCGAAVIISTIWGVNLGSLVTALGVGSVVIGLALQDTLGSLFSGIALVSARSFRVGDWVRFGTDEGPVLAQNWRSVTIRTRNGDALVIPNGVIARAPLTVLGHVGSVVVPAEIRFPYEYSPDMICALLTETATKTPGFHLDPAPAARVAGFEDSGIRYGISVRALDPQKVFAVRSEFLINVWFMCQRKGMFMSGALNADFALTPATPPQKPVSSDELQDTLASMPDFFFRGSDKLGLLTKNARIERYRPSQALVEAGQIATVAHVILKGRARAVQKTQSGDEVILHEFDVGQTIVAKPMLRRTTMPYTIRATQDVEVVTMPVADFKIFCDADMKVAQEVEQIMSAREDAAQRTLTKAQSDRGLVTTAGDRAQLIKDLFRS